MILAGICIPWGMVLVFAFHPAGARIRHLSSWFVCGRGPDQGKAESPSFLDQEASLLKLLCCVESQCDAMIYSADFFY